MFDGYVSTVGLFQALLLRARRKCYRDGVSCQRMVLFVLNFNAQVISYGYLTTFFHITEDALSQIYSDAIFSRLVSVSDERGVYR